jgi:hypothetical protein
MEDVSRKSATEELEISHVDDKNRGLSAANDNVKRGFTLNEGVDEKVHVVAGLIQFMIVGLS